MAIANAVTIQADGRILICGQIPSSSDFPVAAIARYNTNGSLDTSFGTAGVVTATQLGAGLNAIAVQSDGKILVAAPPGGAIVLVGRFNSNGTLDSTFGDSGVFTSKAPISSSGPSGGIVIQSNGDILVAEGLLLRLLGSGQLDSSFGSGGYATTAGYVPSGLAVLANGKILVSSAILSNPSSGGYVSRYSSNGSLDVSFGINGQLASPGPANGIALLSGGNFLISGSLTSSLTGPTTGFAVSRYLGAGITDSTFATHGGAVAPVPTYTIIMTSGQGFNRAATL
ncbi:MAG: delta-60 repeat domain-containing protein [Candidatus Sulfotelmatobacter sp.]